MQPSPTAEWQCLGYITGVMDEWGKLRTLGAVKYDRFNVDYCTPVGGVSDGRVLVKIVRDYLAKISPHERSRDGGASFILPALKAAYPCK